MTYYQTPIVKYNRTTWFCWMKLPY